MWLSCLFPALIIIFIEFTCALLHCSPVCVLACVFSLCLLSLLFLSPLLWLVLVLFWLYLVLGTWFSFVCCYIFLLPHFFLLKSHL